MSEKVRLFLHVLSMSGWIWIEQVRQPNYMWDVKWKSTCKPYLTLCKEALAEPAFDLSLISHPHDGLGQLDARVPTQVASLQRFAKWAEKYRSWKWITTCLKVRISFTSNDGVVVLRQAKRRTFRLRAGHLREFYFTTGGLYIVIYCTLERKST